MIFLSSNDQTKTYTLINNVFFEQIMPIIDPVHLKVYLYAYYISSNKEKIGEKTYTEIAAKLKMTDLELLSAWDYLEKISLIKKHHIDKSTSDNYHIEILPIERFSTIQTKPTQEQQYIMQKNEKLKQMYDKIEEITKLCLNPYDIKKIDAIIKNNDIAYEVVIEAFKFVYHQKKTNNVKDALDTLKSWIKDGIYTTTDLDQNLVNINYRYGMYRNILMYFGEYRLPTKPEQTMMDKWMDTYNFSLEVIKKAIEETLKTKSPNFKYLDGILKNWYEAYQKYGPARKLDNTGYTEFKDMLKDKIDIINIDRVDEKRLRFLYQNYPNHTILSAIKYVHAGKKQVNIKGIYDFIIGQNKDIDTDIDTYGSVTLSQLAPALARYRKETSYNSNKAQKQNTNTKPNNEKDEKNKLEQLILSKNQFTEFLD